MMFSQNRTVAIIGISAELPAGQHADKNLDHESFYSFLMNQEQAYERIPSNRLNIEAWYGNDIGTIRTESGAFLKGIDMFDNVEFGISSRDARNLAPATRKLLEACFLALLDSGIDYRTRNVGCYTSGTSFDITDVADPDEYEPRGSFAGYPSMVSNRVSIHLDLLGPSVPTDTACSSSLTALHLAVQALLNGDCEAAVIGGCQLNHRFIDWVGYSQGSVLSKDGKCKPFDASADGFARSEGCVAIVIKPLEDALRDNDFIYAHILGSAINSTGGGAPPGAPLAEAQRDAMIHAFERAGRNPQDVDFIELHATGTAKGDPTEANWVGKEFFREERELLVGSVKGNIGHTEIAAFLTSLSKVVSIFEHKMIPPNVNIEMLNPAIKWEKYKLQVPRSPVALPVANGDRPLVAIAASGIGGSNGHVVLEGPVQIPSAQLTVTGKGTLPVLLISSGLSPRTTAEIADSLNTVLRQEGADTAAISVTLGRRSRQMTWRSYGILEPGTQPQPVFSPPQHIPRMPNTIAFIFSGQGPQHRDMGRQLFVTFPVFRNSVTEMDSIFQSATGTSIIHNWGLFSGQFSSSIPDIWPIALTLPSITIFQIALFDLLVSFGVKPDLLCGHSAGETAVLYASGAAPKSMAVELAIIRGECFSVLETSGGSMAALSCDAELAECFLSQCRTRHPCKTIEIACYNSPSAVAIAGDNISIDEALKIAKEQGIAGTKIRTRVPIHSSLMERCREDYLSRLHNLFDRYPGPKIPRIPTYSTLTGKLFTESFDAEYFWKNTRSQVKFTHAIESITSHHSLTFIEIAPHPVLLSYLSTMATPASIVLPTIRRPKSNTGQASSEYRSILEFCGQFTAAGHNTVDFFALNHLPNRSVKPRLPSYPFSKKKFPLYPNTSWFEKQTATRFGPLNHAYLKLNRETHPILAEHIIRGEPIMPAAGFLDMALEFGATALMNVELLSLLSLSSEVPNKVDVCLQGSYWSVKSAISYKDPTQPGERIHANGYLSFEEPRPIESIDIGAVRNRCQEHVSSDFYTSLSYFSAYGPSMQRVTYMCYNYTEALASIRGLDDNLAQDGNYVLHPAVLDAAIQVTAYRPFHGDTDPNSYYLPAGVKTLILHQPAKIKYFPAHVYAYLQIRDWTPSSMIYDVMILDNWGKPLCSLGGLRVVKHHFNPPVTVSSPLETVLQRFEPSQLPARLQLTVAESPMDHTKLFKCLDSLSKNAPGPLPSESPFDEIDLPMLRNEWPKFFNGTNLKNLKSNVWDSPHLDRVLSYTRLALRDAMLLFTTESPRRVLRVCIGGGANLVLSILQDLLEEFPDIFCEIFSLTTNLTTRHSKIHRLRIAGIDDNVPANWRQPFDIAITLDLSFPDFGYQHRFLPFNQFLVPGGILIVAKQSSQAWSHHLPGHEWYNAMFGPPATQQQTDLDSFIRWLQTMSCSIAFANYNPEEDPFHFLVVAQTPSSLHQKSPVRSPSKTSHTFRYRFGEEVQLQRQLKLLSDRERLSISILASEGPDGGSSKGLTRALRREYPAWTIRLLIFPHSISHEEHDNILHRLPRSLDSELEITFSPESTIFVTRLLPLPRLTTLPKMAKPTTPSSFPNLSRHQLLLQVLSLSTQGTISGVLATVVNSNSSAFTAGTLVVGLTLTLPTVGGYLPVDADSIHMITCDTNRLYNVAKYIPGFIAAAIAPGLALFRLPHRLNALRILITHEDTEVGRSVSRVYSAIGVEHCAVPRDIGMVALSQMGSFDLILSGYEDNDHIQLLRSLLRPQTGRLSLWDDEITRLLTQDPYSVGHALQDFEAIVTSLCKDGIPAEIPTKIIHRSPSVQAPQLQLRSDKVYVLLGGLGNIGIHIAIFLYQRGARHILLTSRTGEDRVKHSSNIILRRMFHYLQQLPGLTLTSEAIDATSYEHMRVLLSPLKHRLAGCFILTANIQDKLFRDLSQSDFALGFSSKLGVLEVFRKSVDTSTLDFIVAFSSVSSTFGFGGQTNYGAANTALEEAMLTLPNGFSFICPGILDTSLLLATGVKSTDPRLRHHIRWSISAEDMIRWLEHSLYMHQNGVRFTQFMPELDWTTLNQSLGMPRVGQHLVAMQEGKQITVESTEEMLSHIVQDVLGIMSDDFSPEVPLTSYGLDSLSASKLSFSLRSFVEVTQLQLLADMSVNDLRIQMKPKLPSTDEHQPSTMEISSNSTDRELMLKMLNKYAIGLTAWPESPRKNDVGPSGQAILLTGCTGSFGCNILYCLLQCEDVLCIYAFGRGTSEGESLYERQEAAFKKFGFPLSYLASPKLRIIDADFTQEGFGLSEEIIDELSSTVTHIIHNAWKVDFLKPLADFEGLIQGTRRLIDFATRSKVYPRPSLSFISTISVFPRLHDTMLAPEEALENGDLAHNGGYLHSKWVGERLCQIASEKAMLNTNVIRVGLLSGGMNGSWDTSHWVPSIIQSAIRVNCLPSSDEKISWIPVHVAAAAVVEMRTTMNDTLHIVHPHPVPLSCIMKPLSLMLNVPLVPYDEWFARLESSARYTSHSPSQKTRENLSALKLIDFFRLGISTSRERNTESMGLIPQVTLEKGLKASHTLASEQLRPLGADEAKQWMLFWRRVGFVSWD